jgi:hypothetical protein
VLGGNFAVWGGCFACCDCTLTAIRRKEDPWNAIGSGFLTGGILAARAGPKAALSSAVIGGTLLALIEGLGIMITKYTAPAMPTPEDYEASQAVDPTAPPTSAGLSLGGGGGGGLALPASGGSGLPALPTMQEATDNDFMGGGGGTVFESSGSSSSANSGGGEGGGGWWPFGGSK